MRHTRVVLTSIIAVAGLVLILLASGLVTPAGAQDNPTAERRPSEEAVRACIAEFLEVAPEAMELRVGTTDRFARTEVRVRLEDGTRVGFRTRQVDGRVWVVSMFRTIEYTDNQDIGIDRARAKAVAFAEKNYKRWGPDMVETDGERTPSGPYMFHWKRFTDEAYETGDFVWLQLESGNGEVFSYVAHYATHDTPPRIDAEEATQIALEHLQKQERIRRADVSVKVRETRCVLSMPWSEGPVWFIGFEVSLEEEMTDRVRRHLEEVMVDGLTGAILESDDFR